LAWSPALVWLEVAAPFVWLGPTMVVDAWVGWLVDGGCVGWLVELKFGAVSEGWVFLTFDNGREDMG
jgi:hypothetical protein